MTTFPKYAIIDTCDAPCRRLICEYVNGRYFYMKREAIPRLLDFDGMRPYRPTGVEKFGFSIVERDGGQVEFTLTGESTATYEDGKHRKWQEQYREPFTLPCVDLKKLPAKRKRKVA